MAPKADRQRIYLIAIVAIVALVALMTAFGPDARPTDENLGGEAVLSNVPLAGYGNAYACLDSNGELFRSVEPCN